LLIAGVEKKYDQNTKIILDKFLFLCLRACRRRWTVVERTLSMILMCWLD